MVCVSVVTSAPGLTPGPDMDPAKYPHHAITLSGLLVSVIMIANVSAKSILESQWISDVPTLWAGRGGTPGGKRLNSELPEKKAVKCLFSFLCILFYWLFVCV